jgi:hypothetical protein
MSLTKRWSQDDCLSHIVLAHALRQATVRLIFDVRQKKMQPINPSTARLIRLRRKGK